MGFILTYAFYKSGSMWPGIVVHALVDAASKFSMEDGTMAWVYIAATILTALLYCPYLHKLETAKNNRLA